MCKQVPTGARGRAGVRRLGSPGPPSPQAGAPVLAPCGMHTPSAGLGTPAVQGAHDSLLPVEIEINKSRKQGSSPSSAWTPPPVASWGPLQALSTHRALGRYFPGAPSMLVRAPCSRGGVPRSPGAPCGPAVPDSCTPRYVSPAAGGTAVPGALTQPSPRAPLLGCPQDGQMNFHVHPRYAPASLRLAI